MISAMLFCLFLPGMAWPQSVETGSAEYLLAANGFKNLKLGEIMKLIPKSKSRHKKYKYRLAYMDGDDTLDADSCYRYIYEDDDILELSDGVTLDRVGLRTYKNQIVEIYLFFRHDDGYKVLKDFVNNYGTCNIRPTDFTYLWDIGDVSLSLHYRQGVDLGVAIFSSKRLEKRLQQNSERIIATRKAIDSTLGLAWN